MSNEFVCHILFLGFPVKRSKSESNHQNKVPNVVFRFLVLLFVDNKFFGSRTFTNFAFLFSIG